MNNAPLFPWTWELWEFQAASRQPRRASSNGISGEAAELPPLNQGWANQIEVSCQGNDANLSMIDARRWERPVTVADPAPGL